MSTSHVSTSHIDTAVVGAGAAGLIVGRMLAEHGERFEIFDAHERVGDAWRERYRSLRLFTGRRLSSLPGLRLDIGFFDFPTGAQMADHLEEYARRFELPVRCGQRVTRLSRAGDGTFSLEFADGGVCTADRVIVTTGAHDHPIVPDFAVDLDPAIRQVHSTHYRGPEDLVPGTVLVVGAGNSGTDIALEAAREGHETILAGRHPGQVPIDIDTKLGNLMSGLFLSRLRRTTWETPRGRAFLEAQRGHGLNLIRNKLRDLDSAGIRRVPRVTDVRDGLPQLDDGEAVTAATVVWCTGSLPRLDWIDIPGLMDADGPRHERGIATDVPGLAFVGLPAQHSAASLTLVGIPHDAAYVVDHLALAA